MAEEFKWNYDKNRHTLRIESEVMPNFYESLPPDAMSSEITKEQLRKVIPWGEYAEEIELLEAPNLICVTPTAFGFMPALYAADVSAARIIGNSAFYECINLARVFMGKVQLIGVGAFEGCRKLERTSSKTAKIELREVRHVSKYAFHRCESIKTVTFKKQGKRIAEDGHIIQEAGTNLEYLGDGAFAGCLSLKKVYMGGDSGVVVGEHAFYKCPLLMQAEGAEETADELGSDEDAV